MARMNWEILLSEKRVHAFDGSIASNNNNSTFTEVRSAFEKDYDQLIFSYPFRRLQDKTQVIPFPEFDFVHTRLTHSLEVASIGRSFGKLVSKLIFEDVKYLKDKYCPSDIGSLVAAACLAHDIGNPPFGHSGEDSISYFFRETDLLNPANDPVVLAKEIGISETHKRYKKWTDLIKFEGNANGFKIITKSLEKGLNPTSAMIGAFTKYPRESMLISDPSLALKKEDRPKSQTKHGFFQEQKELFGQIAEELQLIKINGIDNDDLAYCRHPLAFLMEAADDIAYQMVDFEDGCRLKLIDFNKQYIFKDKSNNEFLKSPKEILSDIAKTDSSFSITKLDTLIDFRDKLSYLRSMVINVLVHLSFGKFEENYEAIMSGSFDRALVDEVNESVVCENLALMKKLVRDHVYNYKPVLESEASGFEVMGALIDSFAVSTSICTSCGDEETPKQKKLKSLLPSEFRGLKEQSEGVLTFDERYTRTLMVLDYISGMTDNYAISLFKRIKGISLPSHR